MSREQGLNVSAPESSAPGEHIEPIGDSPPIELDGSPASPAEVQYATAVVDFLDDVLPHLGSTEQTATVLSDMAELLIHPMGNADRAIETAREAFQSNPDSMRVARTYRTIARWCNAEDDLLRALEGEARIATDQGYRASLEFERARLLEASSSDPTAAHTAYEAVLEHKPGWFPALLAMERIAVSAGDRKRAAHWAQRLAGGVIDPAVSGEYAARAARHLEAVGQLDEALAEASKARLLAPTSPAAGFALERLFMKNRSFAELASLRESQIEEGLLPATHGWFDIGIIARYQMGDPDLALRAFQTAANADKSDKTDKTADRRSRAIRAELSSLLAAQERWNEAVEMDTSRIDLASDDAERADIHHRIGRIRQDHLDDEDGALSAYEKAFASDGGHIPALTDACDVYARRGMQEPLAETHRRLATVATTAYERGRSLHEAGKALLVTPDHLEEAVQALHAGLNELPSDVSILRSLEKALIQGELWGDLRSHYQYELDLDPGAHRRAWLLCQVAKLSIDPLDDRERASEALHEAAGLEVTGPPEVLVHLADMLEVASEWDTLVPVLKNLAELSPGAEDRAQWHLRLALAHERQGHHDQASETFRMAVRVAPPSHPIQDAARAWARKTGRYDDLAEFFVLAGQTGPDDERAVWLCHAAAVRARHLGSIEAAILLLKEALELVAGHPASVRLLGEILGSANRWEELHSMRSAGAQESSESSEANHESFALERGCIAEAAGDLKSAAAHYGKALESGIEIARLPYLRLLGEQEKWTPLFELYRSAEASGAVGGSFPVSRRRDRKRTP